LRLHNKNWSEGVAKLAVKYSAKMSYKDATEALHELGQVEISENSVWRLTQEWGEALKRIEVREAEQANSVAEETTPGQVIEKEGRLGASMDGCMIYIRGEEWKELKVGCVFEVDWATILDPETKDEVEVGHATNTSYTCHLGGPETFGRKLWTETKRRKWHSAIDTQVVADAAAWIWNLVGDYWYDAHQLVDWYHATEHLGLAAALAFGQGTPQAQRWFKQHETVLFQGHADQIAHTISALAETMPAQCDELLQHAGYFVNQQHRMNYLEMRADGWVIGSGMVESGGKRFKDRFSKAGMRWNRCGAEHLLPVRSAVLSRRFDERWRVAYNSPPI
jgi:hypothetical protein